MFNQGAELGSSRAETPCKPDPEEMLQNARKRKEQYEEAQLHIKELGELGININHESERAIKEMLGNLQISIWEMENTIDYWLKEIDKE